MRSLLRRPSALPLALVIYLLLVLVPTGMGVVGEVAAAWTWGPPPAVAVDLEAGSPTWSTPPLLPNAGSRWGPLLASQTRPLERLQLGTVWLPLAVNSYTGGLADWPARLLHGLTGSARAVAILHLGLGAGLLLLLARFLRRHGWPDAPGVALLLLAADWAFVFYRQVLGGTELLLLASVLLLIWGLWGQRWSPGRRWDLLVAGGLALGLLAKATFVASAVALLIAALITRWDRPPGAERRGARVAPRLGLVLLGCAPLLLAGLHRLALPAGPRVWSHDGLAMQWSRLVHGLRSLASGGGEAAREMPASLSYFLLEPLQWFPSALGAAEPGWGWAWLRCLGWSVVLAGVLVAWRGRPWREAAREPQEALLRFLSLAAPLQLLLLWLANRDLHHLAQALPTMALLAGLACERLAARFAPPRSVGRWVLALGLCLPLVLPGIASVLRTPGLVAELPARAVTERGQLQLERLLEQSSVQRLWTSDYDLYGVFELRAPGIQLAHAWGAASRRRDRQALLVDLLRAAEGGHYLVVRASAARIYDLTPSPDQLLAAAAQAGLEVEEVGRLEDAAGVWAWLYRVGG